MINPLSSKSIGHLIGGFTLLGFSKMIEKIGDGFPLATEGVSTGRLTFHVAALAIVVMAGYCFFSVLRSLFGKQKDASPKAPLFKRTASMDVQTGFDPDAVMQRYLANRPAPSPDERPEPPRPSFGRKSS